MGTIRVMKIERISGSKVSVDFEVSTSSVATKLTVDVDDHGSAGQNEQAAYQELVKFLGKALELAQRQIPTRRG